MALGPIQNATTSINYWLDQNAVTPSSTAAGQKVCWYYEGNQKITYPGVVLHHFDIGGRSDSYEFYNQFSIDIQMNQDNDMMAWAIADSIYQTLGFTTDNVLQIVQIPMLDWTVKTAPVNLGKCVRIQLPKGHAWDKRTDTDKSIRHYRVDLEAYYK